MYCFVKEDLNHLKSSDPMFLQIQYAIHFYQCCFVSIKSGEITDKDSRSISVLNKNIFLRASYDKMIDAIKILEARGAVLLETLANIKAIENWQNLNLSRRETISTTIEELTAYPTSKRISHFLQKNDRIFLKTKHKGYSCKITSSNLLLGDSEVISFLKSHGTDHEELLISPLLNIKSDSLGTKEARFFVMDSKIQNYSRSLHTIKHSVPKSLRIKAEQLVEKITSNKTFPINYVLDVAEFMYNNEAYTDIVEINPITAAMCYINNSIFTEIHSSIQRDFEKLHMGAEYCLDAQLHPERYHNERLSGISYEYSHPEHYNFL